MKCKWCDTEVTFIPDREVGGGMMVEKETGQPHSCKPFLEWEKSVDLHGPTLSRARFQLWLMGPKEAKKRIDLQRKAQEPLLPFLKASFQGLNWCNKYNREIDYELLHGICKKPHPKGCANCEHHSYRKTVHVVTARRMK